MTSNTCTNITAKPWQGPVAVCAQISGQKALKSAFETASKFASKSDSKSASTPAPSMQASLFVSRRFNGGRGNLEAGDPSPAVS